MRRVLGFEGADGNFIVAPKRAPASTAATARKKSFSPRGYYDIPNRLNVPGEDLDKVIHYYREAHPYYNHDVLIVGAKNSACIAALGTLLDRRARHDGASRRAASRHNVKYWIKPNIENRIKSGEVKAVLSSAGERDPAARSGARNAGRRSYD